MEQHKEITYAKYDPAMALMPIVRTTYRGGKNERTKKSEKSNTTDMEGYDSKKTNAFDITQNFNGGSIRMAGPYFMTPLDQSVLLALLGIAGTEPLRLTPEPENEIESMLRQGLECSKGAMREDTIFVDTTLYRLSNLVYGERSEDRYELLQESIFRIKAITVQVFVDGETEVKNGDAKRKKKRWGSSNLLSYAGGDGDRIQVAVNWRLAQAVAGVDVQYVRISLAERHDLNDERAQIIHGWLSAWLRPGRSGSIATDTLAEKIYGASAAGSTQSMRRKRIRDALKLINELPGWSVTSNKSGIHQIRRIGAATVNH